MRTPVIRPDQITDDPTKSVCIWCILNLLITLISQYQMGNVVTVADPGGAVAQ